MMNDDKKESNQTIEQISSFMSKIAAIYHGPDDETPDPNDLGVLQSADETTVPDETTEASDAAAELVEAAPELQATPEPVSVDETEVIQARPDVVESPSKLTSEQPVDRPIGPAIESAVEPIRPVKIREVSWDKVIEDDASADSAGEHLSRRQAKKAREEEDLFLSETEAKIQMKRQLSNRQQDFASPSVALPQMEARPQKQTGSDTSESLVDPKIASRDTARKAIHRQMLKKDQPIDEPQQWKSLKLSSTYRYNKKRLIGIGIGFALGITILITAGIAILGSMNKDQTAAPRSIEEALQTLDFVSGNRSYIERVAEDPAYQNEALSAVERTKEAILDNYRKGHITYDQAYDQLSALAFFMPFWPAELRTIETALLVPAVSAPIVPEEVLAESFAALKSHRNQERNFRIGQQFLNMDLHAAAIPYLRQAVNAGGQNGQAASEQLKRAESSYLVNVINNAQTYISNGDELRARLVLEVADETMPEKQEILNLLSTLPPLDYSTLRLDISAMAMTYFNADRYHGSLLIVQVGRDYLSEIITALEQGEDMAIYLMLNSSSRANTVYLESDDEVWRSELADSLKADIESLNSLENELRGRIVLAIRADATEKADNGKYSEARDLIAYALEFQPNDAELMSQMETYNQLTKLRLNSFINDSTAFGFGLQEASTATDISGNTYRDVTLLNSSAYAPALRLKTLPYKYNRFQGVFYLENLGEAANVQIVIRDGSNELYRSEPINKQSAEVSFDIGFDFKRELHVLILSSAPNAATRYTAQSGVSVILDGYFYNDGSWDEAAAQEQYTSLQDDKKERQKQIEANIERSKQIELFDEIMDDSLIYQIFGKDNLHDSATDSSGRSLEQVVSLTGRETQAVKTAADHLRGEMFFAADSSKSIGLVLMVEDSKGNRWFTQALKDGSTSVKIDMPVEGDFTMSLLTEDGERISQDRYSVLIKAAVYDFDRAGGQ